MALGHTIGDSKEAQQDIQRQEKIMTRMRCIELAISYCQDKPEKDPVELAERMANYVISGTFSK